MKWNSKKAKGVHKVQCVVERLLTSEEAVMSEFGMYLLWMPRGQSQSKREGDSVQGFDSDIRIREEPATFVLDSTCAHIFKEWTMRMNELLNSQDILQFSQDTYKRHIRMTLGTGSDLENGIETPKMTSSQEWIYIFANV